MILLMLILVVDFYFVLSNINSIISSTIKKDIEFAAKLSMLEKIEKKYALLPQTYKVAKMSLYEEEYRRDSFDLIPFFGKFPKSLRTDLKYHVYSKLLSSFPFFQNLESEIINSIGDCLKECTFDRSSLTRSSHLPPGEPCRQNLLRQVWLRYDHMGRI